MRHCCYKHETFLILLWIVFYCSNYYNRGIGIGRTTMSTFVAATELDVSDEYLYHIEEAAGIIIDYEPPSESEISESKKNNNKDSTVLNQPYFIYGPNQGPRVVEFYAPWCPHCQHFRNHYIKFAQQVNNIMKEYGVDGPPVQFYAVSCTVHKKLCRAQGISGYPKIRLFAANTQQNATKEIVYWKLHVFDVLDALQIHVKHLPVDANVFNTITIDDNSNSNTKMKNSVEVRTKKQMFDDAYLSFDFNLRNAIYIHDGPLNNVTQLVLRDWLELAKKTVPVVWQLHTVINELLKDFNRIVANEEHLLHILDQYPPVSKSWSPSCTKGVDGMGYTCGLWQLFHIISIGLVEYNLMISANDDTVLSTLSLRTTDGAETIRNFVEHFLHVMYVDIIFKDYDDCAHNRCHRLSSTDMTTEQWILFPLWLFETHNAVNVRLYQERMAREQPNQEISFHELMQVRWPTKSSCPMCWLDNDGWDEEAVYKYLRTEYWSEDLISADYRAEVTRKKPDSDDVGIGTTSYSYAQLILQVTEWCVVIGLIGTWYVNRMKRIRSGLHKKRDLEC